MIPDNINRTHVLKALEEIERSGVPAGWDPPTYVLVYRGRKYPPKYVVALANRFANGAPLDPTEFSGGKETNRYLVGVGFPVRILGPEGELGTPWPIWLEAIFEGKTRKRHRLKRLALRFGLPVKHNCPKDGPVRPVPVRYGLPISFKGAGQGRFLLGGCTIMKGLPLYGCPTCGGGFSDLGTQ